MEKQNIEEIVCGLDKDGLPNHIIKVIEENKTFWESKCYCFDSRPCKYKVTGEKECYCSYKQKEGANSSQQ